MKERASIVACFAAMICCDGINYSTTRKDCQEVFAMAYYSVGFMLCKLLILMDKLRVALEWIHSDGLRTDDADSPGLSMPGNSTEYRAAE